ncbi:uncharacterized protein TNCV_2337031 [Trichonephila clavipes]|nr:uncharacterized protein TNCV_2337031 [Trichonephila clavipes]
MAASSSSVIPTPLAHADNQGEGRPTKFNLYDPGVGYPEEGPRLVSDIRVSVSAEYSHGLCAVKISVVKSIPCHTQ